MLTRERSTGIQARGGGVQRHGRLGSFKAKLTTPRSHKRGTLLRQC